MYMWLSEVRWVLYAVASTTPPRAETVAHPGNPSLPGRVVTKRGMGAGEADSVIACSAKDTRIQEVRCRS
jgi:hypothetical protein